MAFEISLTNEITAAHKQQKNNNTTNKQNKITTTKHLNDIFLDREKPHNNK